MKSEDAIIYTAAVVGGLFASATLFFLFDYLQGEDRGNVRALNFGIFFAVIWIVFWIPVIYKVLTRRLGHQGAKGRNLVMNKVIRP